MFSTHLSTTVVPNQIIARKSIKLWSTTTVVFSGKPPYKFMLMWIIFTYLVKSIRNVTSLFLKNLFYLFFFSAVGISQLESHLRYRLYYSQFPEIVAVVNSRWAEKSSAFLTFVYFRVYFFANVNYSWCLFVVCSYVMFVHLFFLLFQPQIIKC